MTTWSIDLGVSSQCQSSLAGIVSSPDAQCINAAGLAPIFLGDSNTSVVPPLNTWLTGFCSKDACSNHTLAALVTNLTNGCSSDLSALGLTNPNTNLTSTVQQFYPTVRQVLCLQDNSTHQFCAVDALYDIQNQTGTISINNIFPLVPQIFWGGLPARGLSPSVTCNNCTKTAYNIIISNVPKAITSDENTTISNQCGPSFIDGKNPAGISQTATGNSLPHASGQSGAFRSLALWDGLMILAGLGIFSTVLL
ncbi:hypothetical protein BC827DRAFT_1222200 [Russula dissimulans]|nr:hypothetical protein BC827DRAFT_1222200 [Russula dissimulans]